jgi:hypothetical protein
MPWSIVARPCFRPLLHPDKQGRFRGHNGDERHFVRTINALRDERALPSRQKQGRNRETATRGSTHTYARVRWEGVRLFSTHTDEMGERKRSASETAGSRAQVKNDSQCQRAAPDALLFVEVYAKRTHDGNRRLQTHAAALEINRE